MFSRRRYSPISGSNLDIFFPNSELLMYIVINIIEFNYHHILVYYNNSGAQ